MFSIFSSPHRRDIASMTISSAVARHRFGEARPGSPSLRNDRRGSLAFPMIGVHDQNKACRRGRSRGYEVSIEHLQSLPNIPDHRSQSIHREFVGPFCLPRVYHPVSLHLFRVHRGSKRLPLGKPWASSLILGIAVLSRATIILNMRPVTGTR